MPGSLCPLPVGLFQGLWPLPDSAWRGSHLFWPCQRSPLLVLSASR